MKTGNRLIALAAMALLGASLHAADVPLALPDPDGKPGDASNDFRKELEGGKVTIAASSFLRYNHPRFGVMPPRGHISLWLEEMKNPPVANDS